MFSLVRKVCLAALVAAFATPMLAATYIVPSDAEMIQKSDDIVVGTAVASTVERDAHGAIVTRYVLRVERVLKGDLPAGGYLTLTEQGGILGGKARLISGAPEYIAGMRYLVFTGTDRTMEPTTFGLALGQFSLVEEQGETLAVRADVQGFDQNLEPYTERPRHAARFESYIRDVVAQRSADPRSYFVSPSRQIAAESIASLSTFSRGSYLMNGQFRWQSTPDASFVLSVQAPHVIPTGGAEAVSTAIASWNGTGTSIAYSQAGTDNTAVTGLTVDDGKDAVLFGDPNNEVDSPAVAVGGAFGDIQYDLDGETFVRIIEADVVVEDGFSSCLGSVMTHEMGHTLGIRHSATPPTGKTCGTTAECTSNAIMNASLGGTLCTRNGALLDWDINAATTVYGSGPVCAPPTIGTQPQSKTVEVGVQTSLTVTPSGTGPFTFQWFFGTSGDTSSPVNGATSSTISITPTTTGVGSYWVRVGHTCDSVTVNSTTATVTATCTNPAITAQPQSVTITGGQSTTLQVGATGSGLTFQWFRGAAGDRSDPLGSNSNRLTVSPSETTQYWVHISGACGAPVDSAAATVTVVPCPEITVNPPTATPGTGAGKYTLNVTASSTSGPLSFGWFRGGTPGFGGTAIGTGQSINVTVTAATGFWARVQNGCGRVEFSSLITVAPCTLPSITTQPQDQTINSGDTANLSIAFTAGATVKWYRGSVGDKTNQVGSTANVTVGPLTETTKFWAEVSTTCGPVASREATVTVRQLTELVPMLGARFFVQVAYKNQFDNNKTGKLLGRSLFSTALSETAVFTFGDQNVIELMVRVSDARPFDNHIHVFLGGLSDVEFSVVVTDTATGIIHEYKKPANQLVGVIDRTTFPAPTSLLPILTELKMAPNAETSTIRLLNNRFEVRMHYRNQFTNPAGEGYMNARSIASSPTTETAVFFFDENVGSAEWMVRFSDARPFADRIDMFHGGLSDVEFTIEVLDTKTGLRKEYHKGPFSLLGEVDRASYLP